MSNKHYALIPAKLHSSRCPNKNWKAFIGDKNLVTFLISIIPPNFFEQTILSTDKNDVEPIEKVTIHHRPQYLATTQSPVNDLISLLIEEYAWDDDGYIWLLNPTSPLREVDDFYNIRALIAEKGYKSIISVSPINSFIWKDDEPLFETAYPRRNTQDCNVKYYIENGQFFVFKVNEFKRSKTWYSDNTLLYKQPRFSSRIDIDTEQDFSDAQLMSGQQVIPDDTLKNETLLVGKMIKEPLKEHVQLLFNHFNRYGQAVKKLRITPQEQVIDASCGHGYGSFILSLTAHKVFGLDIEPAYIQVARTTFNADNVAYYTYDEYEELKHKVDKIVCIETLEHIDKTEINHFIKRLVSYLKDQGSMFLTFPLGNNQPSLYNRYHLNEPSIDFIYDSFSPFFKKISMEISKFTNSFGYQSTYCYCLLESFGDNYELQKRDKQLL